MKNDHARTLLQQEIDTACSTLNFQENIPPYNQISQLPYLHACISEALRLSPAVGDAFPREVPTGGATILDDTVIPERTVVSLNNWVMGRNKTLYGEDAEEFKPERWLVPENAKLFKEYEFSFGHGARV